MVLDDTSSTDSSIHHQSDAESGDQYLSDDAWRQMPVRGRTAAVAPRELWAGVRAIIDEHLTQRQREVVELYFLRGLDQATVATLLGISQQSVSEHLFGKTRDGAQVGGVIRKLRKLCARQGIMPRATSRVAIDDDDLTSSLDLAD